MSDQKERYPFEFTALPHVFTDFWMPLLSPTGIATMIALYRATIGWQQTEAAVSFPKLAAMTGIASYDTLSQDLEELRLAGLIQRKAESGKQRTIIYQLMESALTFTDFVKWLQEQMKDKTFTETVKQPLQNPKRPFFRNRKADPSESVKQKSAQASHQTRQEQVQNNSERGAKETLLKETFSKKDKEIAPSPVASARSPNGSPDVLMENEEQKTKTPDASPSAPPSAIIAPHESGTDVGAGAATAEIVEAAAKHQERLAERERLRALHQEKSTEQQERAKRDTALMAALKKATPGSAQAEDLQRQRMALWDEMAAGQKELGEIERAYRDLEGEDGRTGR